ncbi:hypothetical protein SISNIDRAFT_469587 [Sistotremastrum niveocremeum HHB9708]|uniref:Uncharacterized protein n=1 Tax=Sistotremastrum niveocremeum HHB9708 TaxID=1314777 RepID=A0A164PVT0_9AGAM|nr:hypothetical protein SISNIDRAFT_469587 [Sistotremastrum niveocremeum HHB9708]
MKRYRASKASRVPSKSNELQLSLSDIESEPKEKIGLRVEEITGIRAILGGGNPNDYHPPLLPRVTLWGPGTYRNFLFKNLTGFQHPPQDRLTYPVFVEMEPFVPPPEAPPGHIQWTVSLQTRHYPDGRGTDIPFMDLRSFQFKVDGLEKLFVEINKIILAKLEEGKFYLPRHATTTVETKVEEVDAAYVAVVVKVQAVGLPRMAIDSFPESASSWWGDPRCLAYKSDLRIMVIGHSKASPETVDDENIRRMRDIGGDMNRVIDVCGTGGDPSSLVVPHRRITAPNGSAAVKAAFTALPRQFLAAVAAKTIAVLEERQVSACQTCSRIGADRNTIRGVLKQYDALLDCHYGLSPHEPAQGLIAALSEHAVRHVTYFVRKFAAEELDPDAKEIPALKHVILPYDNLQPSCLPWRRLLKPVTSQERAVYSDKLAKEWPRALPDDQIRAKIAELKLCMPSIDMAKKALQVDLEEKKEAFSAGVSAALKKSLGPVAERIAYAELKPIIDTEWGEMSGWLHYHCAKAVEAGVKFDRRSQDPDIRVRYGVIKARQERLLRLFYENQQSQESGVALHSAESIALRNSCQELLPGYTYKSISERLKEDFKSGEHVSCLVSHIQTNTYRLLEAIYYKTEATLRVEVLDRLDTAFREKLRQDLHRWRHLVASEVSGVTAEEGNAIVHLKETYSRLV